MRRATLPKTVPRAHGAAYELDGAGEYRAGPGGAVAVPTGRVFVRFSEGTDPETRTAEIECAGFALESVPAYAPHAAWVRPASGETADALNGFGRLRDLPGVERVEPQFESEAARR